MFGRRRHGFALNNARRDFLHGSHARRGFGLVVLLVVLFALVALGREWLRKLAAVAVERVRLEAEFPAEPVARANIFNRRVGGEIDGL